MQMDFYIYSICSWKRDKLKPESILLSLKLISGIRYGTPSHPISKYKQYNTVSAVVPAQNDVHWRDDLLNNARRHGAGINGGMRSQTKMVDQSLKWKINRVYNLVSVKISYWPLRRIESFYWMNSIIILLF